MVDAHIRAAPFTLRAINAAELVDDFCPLVARIMHLPRTILDDFCPLAYSRSADNRAKSAPSAWTKRESFVHRNRSHAPLDTTLYIVSSRLVKAFHGWSPTSLLPNRDRIRGLFPRPPSRLPLQQLLSLNHEPPARLDLHEPAVARLIRADVLPKAEQHSAELVAFHDGWRVCGRPTARLLRKSVSVGHGTILVLVKRSTYVEKRSAAADSMKNPDENPTRKATPMIAGLAGYMVPNAIHILPIPGPRKSARNHRVSHRLSPIGGRRPPARYRAVFPNGKVKVGKPSARPARRWLDYEEEPCRD
jgi:hypothetical protein